MKHKIVKILLTASLTVLTAVLLKNSLFKSSQFGQYSLDPVDSQLLVEIPEFGQVPSNVIGIILSENKNQLDAQKIASQINGSISGKIEFINFYQINIPPQNAEGLQKLVNDVNKLDGVDVALLDAEIKSRAISTSCDPLDDPTYLDSMNDALIKDPLALIGVKDAWKIIKATGVNLSPVQVGVIDEQIGLKNSEISGNKLITTINPDRDTGRGRYSHANMVVNIIGADPNNGGITGIASVLGEKLLLQTSNVFDADISIQTEDVAKSDLTKFTDTNGKGYIFNALVKMTEQVDKGSKVINLSFGPSGSGDLWQDHAKAINRFLTVMNQKHPDVLFVAAAGDNKTGLDGNNDFWGQKLPNLMTVGGVTGKGESYSNFQSEGGEISISGVAGIPYESGWSWSSATSSIAPQVTSVASLLKSINPDLTAAQIKDVIVSTSASTIGNVTMPANVGGMLRADEAVLKVINDLRTTKGLSPLDKNDIIKLYDFSLSSNGGPEEFQIQATTETLSTKAESFSLSITGENFSLSGNNTQTLSKPGSINWDVIKKDQASVLTAKVVRNNSGSCRQLIIGGTPPIEELAGDWEGTWEVVDFVKPNEKLLDPLIIDIYEELKGIPIKFIIQLEPLNDSSIKGLLRIIDTYQDDDVDFVSHAVEMKYEDGVITATYDRDDGHYVFSGTASYTDSGLRMEGYWNTVDENSSMQTRWEVEK